MEPHEKLTASIKARTGHEPFIREVNAGVLEISLAMGTIYMDLFSDTPDNSDGWSQLENRVVKIVEASKCEA